MPDTTPGTDSTEPAATPQGTEAPANDQPGQTEGGAAPALPQGFDDDFLKRLDDLSTADPATLPKGFNEHFVPKAEFTRKTQALADERRALAEREKLLLEIQGNMLRNAQPKGPDARAEKLKQLEELSQAGSPEATRELYEMKLAERLAPIERQTAWNNAQAMARSSDPAVAQYWDQVNQVLNSSPELAAMAQAENFKYGHKVIQALAIEQEKNHLKTVEVPKLTAEVAALKAKLSQYEKERVQSLPGSTTKAGTTTGRAGQGDFNTFMDGSKAAFIAAGGHPDDWR